jgi:hypothetical protein
MAAKLLARLKDIGVDVASLSTVDADTLRTRALLLLAAEFSKKVPSKARTGDNP